VCENASGAEVYVAGAAFGNGARIRRLAVVARDVLEIIKTTIMSKNEITDLYFATCQMARKCKALKKDLLPLECLHLSS